MTHTYIPKVSTLVLVWAALIVADRIDDLPFRISNSASGTSSLRSHRGDQGIASGLDLYGRSVHDDSHQALRRCRIGVAEYHAIDYIQRLYHRSWTYQPQPWSHSKSGGDNQ